MQKRRIVKGSSTFRSKIRKTIKADQEVNNNLHFNLPYLPVEIITNIITNLTDTNDIKNCMLLSKDVNSFIFRTPKIINKFKFNLDCIEDPEATYNFMRFKGRHVKSMTITYDLNSYGIWRMYLIAAPKLEELVLTNKDSRVLPELVQDWMTLWMPLWHAIPLSGLKSLKIELRDLQYFIRFTKEVKTLEKLSIFISTSTDQSFMTEFILQQDNLKELNITVAVMGPDVKFPTRDITKDIKFKLKTLKILSNRKRISNLQLDRFLVTQANSLEELEFDSSPSDRTLVSIFYRFKNLKKFRLQTDSTSMMIRNARFFMRKLKVVTDFEDMNTSGVSLTNVFHVLPNLVTLKCIYLNNSAGCFTTLNDLDVNNLKISNLKHVRMDNLKKLTVKKLMEVNDDVAWLKFVETVGSVDTLAIKGIENIENLPIVLNNLKSFKKLQKFSFLHNPGIGREDIMNFNETIPAGYKFYEIEIDINEKTVKISSHIIGKCKEILDVLVKSYEGFEFFEICVEGEAGH
ncbi:hypothetical protein ACKWTF_014724 [Chironomus riparius]